MLDMDLVQGRPALEVEFQISLAADLLHVTGLVMNAPWLEGLDQWVYATRAALPPTLKSDMGAVLTLTQKAHALNLWVGRLPPDASAHRSFADAISWFNTFTEDDYQSLIQDTLEHLAEYCEDADGLSASPEHAEALIKNCFQEHLSQEELDLAVRLSRNPAELKAQFISILTRFWEQFYREERQRCLPLMERSVEHHRRQGYSADFATVFTAVTGRRLPKEFGDYEDVERIIFIPSCHIGPYIIKNEVPELLPTISMHYNCRPTGTPERDQAPAIQDLFPPLKALADETRLQILSILDGRELYAQEIVDQLDISQSAVSRHLKLMVTGGLLNMRKEDSMKYFSISERVLAALADRLKSFRGKGTKG